MTKFPWILFKVELSIARSELSSGKELTSSSLPAKPTEFTTEILLKKLKVEKKDGL